MWLLGYLKWLIRRLLGYLGWLLGCCYAFAKVPGLVARVHGAVARVLLGGC